MAELSTAEKQALQQLFEDEASAGREVIAIGRQDLAAALAAIDQWVDNNVGAFNSAIPEPCRSKLGARQKAKLLFLVARRRMEVS